MTNGLNNNSPVEAERLKAIPRDVDSSSTIFMDRFKDLLTTSCQYTQLYLKCLRLDYPMDGLVYGIFGRVLASTDAENTSPVGASNHGCLDPANGRVSDIQSGHSLKPPVAPKLGHLTSLSQFEKPPKFSSVKALTSATHDGLDKHIVSPITEGDEASSAAASLTSFHSVENLPIATLPRTGMPLYNPIQREGEFVCGWGAAFINICVTFPINKAIFRQQLHGISGHKAIRQLRKDGLRYLYRGLLPPLLQKTMSSSVMFGMYFHCQDVLKEQFPKMGTIPNHAIAAMISGTLEATLMPFERIQTLMQNREFHSRFSNTPDAFRHVWSYGLKEYYRGLSLIIWRNGPSNVAFFLGREYLQELGPQSTSHTNKMLRDFISGACLGAMISTVFFPLNVVKTRMQSKLGGPHDTARATLQVLLEERKGRYRELFKGVHLNYTRSFISWGIINASFEVLINLYNRNVNSNRHS
ncbi:solute carrier family 25 member [Plakobranchus ocellatus]|uniref:Solute carrier family 25 member n=1 Tax=Plakobranchus ocellatus TaxID=259542 RepID=A0AAV4D030_9GAST|nr:solute carrier family 25 member [Plakobranchus ocellatus]